MITYQEVLVRSPLRLPLGGGGTDLPFFLKKYGEGFLVVGSLSWSVRIHLKRLNETRFRININQVEWHGKLFEDFTDPLIVATLKYCNWSEKEGLDIHIDCDIPSGTGMGFSGAMVVGLLQAIITLQGKHTTSIQLAETAYYVESVLCKRIVGKQDHYGAAIGGLFTMKINALNQVKVSRLQLKLDLYSQFKQQIQLYYTGIKRNADLVLSSQGQAVSSNEEKSHAMYKILKIGFKSFDALKMGEIQKFGYLLNEHWLLKRSLTTAMSSDSIDIAYNEVLNKGAFGGKLMGAGGGGFLMICADEKKQNEVKATLAKYDMRPIEYDFDIEGVRVEWKI